MHLDKIRFSKTALDAIPTPSKGLYYFDTEVSGLAVRVLPSGFKTYYLYKRLKGKDYRIKIGSADDISVFKARELAKYYKEEILAGNPVQTGAKDKNALTLKDLYQYFLSEKRAYLAPRTYQDYLDLWRRYCQKIGHKPVSDISTDDMRNLHYHLTVEKGIPYAANRTIMMLKAVYNLCIRSGLYKQLNPCLAVKLNKEKPRIRALGNDEMNRFLDAVREFDDPTSRNAIMMMLYTAARKSNVLSMAWKDLDLEKGVWVIPKTKTSDNEPIALVPQAQEILKEMWKISTNQFVFSSYSRTGHLVDIREAWNTILRNAGIKNFRLHDIRHTLATRLIADGVPVFTVKKILTHKSIASTQVYVNLGVEDVRGDLTKTVNKIMERK